MSATIRFQTGTRRKAEYLSFGTNLYKVQRFAERLASYTTAGITKVSVTSSKMLSIPEKSGSIESLELFAKLLIRHRATNKMYGLMVPAPDYSIFEGSTGDGTQVKQAIGALMTQYYTEMCGEVFDYEDGWLVGSTL